MGSKIYERILRIKNRDSKFLEGTMLEDDFQWLIEQVEEQQKSNTPKPLEEWQYEDADCLWWSFPIDEPPYVGTPLDADFPDYVTHFTEFSMPES